MFCEDGIGCKQCVNGYSLEYDSMENINYCQAVPTQSPVTPAPTVSNNCDDGIQECNSYKCTGAGENPYCSDQQSWGCASCNSGYFMKSKDYPCVLCSTLDGCISCRDYSGCVTCDSSHTFYWDSECGIGRCRL